MQKMSGGHGRATRSRIVNRSHKSCKTSGKDGTVTCGVERHSTLVGCLCLAYHSSRAVCAPLSIDCVTSLLKDDSTSLTHGRRGEERGGGRRLLLLLTERRREGGRRRRGERRAEHRRRVSQTERRKNAHRKPGKGNGGGKRQTTQRKRTNGAARGEGGRAAKSFPSLFTFAEARRTEVQVVAVSYILSLLQSRTNDEYRTRPLVGKMRLLGINQERRQ